MLFRKDIPRQCAYCVHGTACDEDQIQCARKGIKKPDDHCLFFAYDPTKRIPGKAKAVDFEKYEDYDYSL